MQEIAPCKGVKQCEENDCTYITSTRESKPCLTHPKAKLKSSGHCPVDFYYVWPINPDDKRRWIGGLVHSASMQPHSPGLSTVVLASKILKLVVVHCSITLKINSEVEHEILVQLLTDSSVLCNSRAHESGRILFFLPS